MMRKGEWDTFLGIREKPFRDDELTALCRAVGLKVLGVRHKSLGIEVGLSARKCEGPFAPNRGNREGSCASSWRDQDGP